MRNTSEMTKKVEIISFVGRKMFALNRKMSILEVVDK